MMHEDDETGLEMANVNRMNPFTIQDAYDDAFLDDDDMESARINREGHYSVVGGGSKSSRRITCRCVLVFIALVTIGSYAYSIFTTTEEMGEQHEDYDSFVDGKNHKNTDENPHGGKIPTKWPVASPVSHSGSADAPSEGEGYYGEEEKKDGGEGYYGDDENEKGEYYNEEDGEEEEPDVNTQDGDTISTLSPVAVIPSTPEPTVEVTISTTLSPVQAIPDTPKPTEEAFIVTLSPIQEIPDTPKPTAEEAFTVTLSPVQAVTPEPTKEVTPVHNQKQNVEEWLSSTVSISDGIKFEVVGRLEHDKNAFLEGLCFGNDGFLYESTGLFGKSDIRKLDPVDGTIIEKVEMNPVYFGEGLTIVNDSLVQLTYKKKKGFVYDMKDLDVAPSTFDYTTPTGEGWGMTYDPDKDELILNDGMDYLIFWDAQTYQEKRTVKVVRQDGTPAAQINELEFWRGRVLANVWFQDVILVINPETGVVEKEYDFSSLSYNKNGDRDAVLNGISVSDDPDLIYVSGKLWDTIFKVRLL